MQHPEKGKHQLTGLIHRLLPYRTWIQAGFTALWLAPLKWFSICAPVFHCHGCPLASFACPIGVLAGSSALHLFPIGALAVLVAVGASVGTATCGWACPFGWLQDLASQFRPRHRLDLPQWAGYARYGVLAGLVLAVPYFFGSAHPLFICRVCPAAGLEVSVPRLIKSVFAGGPAVWPDIPKFVILGVFILAIFVFHRPWCKVFCPLGAIFSLFNKFSLISLRINAERCADCLRCTKSCAVGLHPAHTTNSHRCIRCFKCLSCPKKAVEVVPSLLKFSSPQLPYGS